MTFSAVAIVDLSNAALQIICTQFVVSKLDQVTFPEYKLGNVSLEPFS